jgi:hypothetical protein
MLIYYIDGEQYTTEEFDDIPLHDISSPDENTPAFQDTLTSEKLWCEKNYRWHRLTGPTLIRPDETVGFWLNDKKYHNVRDWIKDHPNPDLYFDALGMNETDRVLWFLQN